MNALLELLDERDPQIKALSIWALGEIGYGQVVGRLSELLLVEESVSSNGLPVPESCTSVSSFAEHALECIGTPEAKRRLDAWRACRPNL